ncbi:MAG: glutamate-cysteine ligase family protein [Planctomycetaceae bacterium]
MSDLSLFSAFGVELEYMLVDSESGDIRPICDQVLQAASGGEVVSDIERGPIAWSNELTLHVIELKTNGPAASLAALPSQFEANVREINELAGQFGARLLPTAMHPWMDPHREMRLWPHDYGPVYETFHRIFDCRGHGWANLQSVHLNLPFADDDEFARLHSAVRLILPLLPALAASSPIMESRVTGVLDNRLEVYRTNARKIRSVSGRIIPEPAFSESEYRRQIYAPLLAEMAPHDPEHILQEEFLNARGAIARFDRGAIEIRLLDVQETPRADVAICATIVAVLKQLVAEKWTNLSEQQQVQITPLESCLLRSIRDADMAVLDDPQLLRHFGAADLNGGTVGDLWRRLVADVCQADPEFDKQWGATVSEILDRGPLSRAILRHTGEQPSHDELRTVYGELATGLTGGELFH